jgi:hypothetical protein
MLAPCLAVSAMILFASPAVWQARASAARLPDLVVKNVQTVQDCNIQITLANIGRGSLPPSAYDLHHGAAIQLYKDGKAWGGIRLGGVDTGRQLARPGGTVSFLWFPNAANLKLSPGSHRIKVTVDNKNTVRESNEGNNTLQRTLRCGGSARLPDLRIVKMGVDRNCKVWVTVTNAGPGKVPDQVWTSHSPQSAGVYLHRNGQKWGGASIWKFDPGKKLQKPGGMATFRSSLPVNGAVTIKAVVDLWDKVKETNEGNNTLQRRLNCGGGGAGGGGVQGKPDVGLYGFMKIGKRRKLIRWNESITLTPADARLVSHGKPAFDIYYGYREYDGHPTGTFKNKLSFNSRVVSIQSNLSLQAKQIRQVATQAYMGPDNGKLCLKIDADNEISESREDNNYSCVNVRFRGFNRPTGGSNHGRAQIPGRVKDVPHKKPNFVLPNDKVKGGALAR